MSNGTKPAQAACKRAAGAVPCLCGKGSPRGPEVRQYRSPNGSVLLYLKCEACGTESLRSHGLHEAKRHWNVHCSVNLNRVNWDALHNCAGTRYVLETVADAIGVGRKEAQETCERMGLGEWMYSHDWPRVLLLDRREVVELAAELSGVEGGEG